MRWADRLADAFTDWLASPAALIQGLALTLVWGAAVALGLDSHGFWLMFAYTIVSFITQFPLAYASRRSERHMLNLMRLVLAMAEEIKSGQDEQDQQLDDIEGRLR